MSDTAAILTAIVGTIGTIGAGLITAIVQLRRSRQAGVREKDIQAQEHALARDQHSLAALSKTVDALQHEAAWMRSARLEDREEMRRQRERIESLEESSQQLAVENRTFRQVILGVMERLRRKPPDEPESILAYILTHLPHFGKESS